MLFIQIIFCYNLKDEILIYSLLEINLIHLILYEEVSLGIFVSIFEKKDIYSFNLSYFYTQK